MTPAYALVQHARRLGRPEAYAEEWRSIAKKWGKLRKIAENCEKLRNCATLRQKKLRLSAPPSLPNAIIRSFAINNRVKKRGAPQSQAETVAQGRTGRPTGGRHTKGCRARASVELPGPPSGTCPTDAALQGGPCLSHCGQQGPYRTGHARPPGQTWSEGDCRPGAAGTDREGPARGIGRAGVRLASRRGTGVR